MKLRPFGSTGVDVPVIGQGTWKMEGDGARAVDALKRGLDLGMTHIDTAEMYGRGAVERLVGRAIKGRREEVFLVSKVLPDNASQEGTIDACGASLRRLGTSWLDCYLLHWPSRHPLEDTIAAFEKLQADGKIRTYGVSNFSVTQLEKAISIAGEGKIACNQVPYSIRNRKIERDVIPFCEAHNIALVGYSPFDQGSFRSTRTIEAVAGRAAVTPRQVTLAFLTRFPHSFAIPKATEVPHVEENAGAADFMLDAEALESLG